MEKLDTKSRKKAFDQLFKATIIPFFEKEGFVSVSKTSKKFAGNGCPCLWASSWGLTPNAMLRKPKATDF